MSLPDFVVLYPLGVGVPRDGRDLPSRRCPGCQYAEWQPLCDAIIDFQGTRVGYAGALQGCPTLDPVFAAMPEAELDTNDWDYCGYLDLTVSWLDGEDGPDDWSCPHCGGNRYIGVHRTSTAGISRSPIDDFEEP